MLVDEKTLWPNGQFPTTVLIVRTQYLQEHPDTIAALIRGEQKAIDFAAGERGRGQDGHQRLRSSSSPGPSLAPGGARPGVHRAASSPSTRSPPRSRSSSKDSVTAGVTDKETNLKGFIDVTALNGVLTQAGKPAVDAAGLDKAQG